MNPAPPKKSRRIAKRKRKEQSDEQTTNNDNNNLQDILAAAVPLITQNVISVLEQRGVINSNNQSTDQNGDKSVSDTDVPQQVVLPGSQDIPLIDFSPTSSNIATQISNGIVNEADRALQHTSIALYQYMCQHVVGLEVTVKTKRLLMAIKDNLSYTKYRADITSGSFGEGLEMRGSDLDYMIVLKHIEVHENPSGIQCFPLRTYFTVVTDDTKLGFVKLLLLCSPIDSIVNLCVEYEGKKYLSNQRIKSAIKPVNKFSDYLTQINHGPCLSDKDGLFDFAICVHMRSWINEARLWMIRPNSSWPSDDVKSNIMKQGVLFVPIGVKGSPNEEIEWRISFSVGEKMLINSFTHTQLLCYALMKISLKDINQDKNCKDLLCSYFIKNVIFWVSEESSILIWKPCNIISCFIQCFRRLIYCVEYSICPHYFIPENNMFENKIEGQSRDLLLEKLNALHDQDWKFILYSPQLRDFLRKPCIKYTESQLFISYFEQMNLSAVLSFSRLPKDIYNQFIQGFSSYISPKVKSYYLYYLSMYSQQQAGAVSLNREQDNYKQMYQDYKLSQSYLLQGTSHDAVSGWLLLSTLFYKIKQHRKALFILYYALSKCSEEKLFKYLKLSCVHRELLRANVLQSKGLINILKFLRIENIVLDMNSNLVPTELEIEKYRSSRLIPSVVYAHFLSFSCHFNLRDARQIRQSLEDLQLTISDSYFISDLHEKSISYDCLGIALQLVGEKDLAKQAFRNSIQFDPVGLFSCARERLVEMDAK